LERGLRGVRDTGITIEGFVDVDVCKLGFLVKETFASLFSPF
jgi:hypothetical protein